MVRALTVSEQQDLRPFMAVLRACRLSHHVTEESGSLVIWAPDEAHAKMIVSAYEQWQQGALELPALPSAPDTKLLPVKSLLQGFLDALWLAPITVLLIIACLLVAVLSNMGADAMAVRMLFFPELDQSAGSPVAALFSGLNSAGDWLRTLTPALLHFGPVHLVFNMLWLWFFGRMMEPVLGVKTFLAVITLTAFFSNVAQYLWSGTSNFGGMSGVVYGQVGFVWMWQSVRPHTSMRLPLPMIMVFLVGLVLMEVFASSMIASAAHLGGLLSGMLLGLTMAMMFTWLGKNRGTNGR
jgi:GlpG protein